MSIGLIGRKLGMTRIFSDSGKTVPVTVIQVEPNRVTQIKNAETDGYCAIQVTTGARKASRMTKAEIGHFAKAGVEAGRGLWEFRLEPEELAAYKVGSEIKVDALADVKRVDVTGRSKGKGTAGTIKRYHFNHQDFTHGNSRSHRVPGSTGQCQSPGHVFKGKRMVGHMGSDKVTIQSLELVRIDSARNLLLVKGAVPGANNGDVIVKPSVKA